MLSAKDLLQVLYIVIELVTRKHLLNKVAVVAVVETTLYNWTRTQHATEWSLSAPNECSQKQHQDWGVPNPTLPFHCPPIRGNKALVAAINVCVSYSETSIRCSARCRFASQGELSVQMKSINVQGS